ncbi:Arsenite oxidase small subunit precursor [hydrothermal vent metagenome]|uniref:Arsenite oxidase small subunit n=1 Tax=hydrothermal vent metagenome TaxID=652676 RepID=A0A3B1BYJ0_9ZZZZ
MSDPNKFTGSCANRREFLLAGGVSAALMMANGPVATALTAKVKQYPRKKITSLRRLKTGEPINFYYPDKKAENIMVKLGEPAGGGVGPDNDIVAFSTLCTHMGGEMGLKKYKHKDKAYGPCSFHLSTFDLTKHGMVIAGHATQSLPQIQLEVVKKNVYAVGVLGLIYGRAANLDQKYGEVIEPSYTTTPKELPVNKGRVPKPAPAPTEPEKRKIFDDLRGTADSDENGSDKMFDSSPIKSRRRPR